MASASDDLPHVPFTTGVDMRGEGDIHRLDRRRHARQVQGVIVVALAWGGVFGALCRYAISLAIPTETGQFPWSTFLINLSGSAVLGFVLILLIEQFPRGRLARPVIGTGFIGAYTTFSTFEVDTVELIRDGHVAGALTYLLASVGGGLLVVWLGMASARLVLRAERWLQEETR